MKSTRLSGPFVFVSAALCLAGVDQQDADVPGSTTGNYRVLTTYKIGGEGGWDYLVVDDNSRRLFVTRSSRVVVLDADTGEIVGEIADTPGVHGVALVHDIGRGFTSNGRANTATIFDLKTLKVLGSVETGENPDAIVYEPTTKRVFTMNAKSHDATAIDAAAGKAVGRIELGGKPEFAVADGAGRIYVNLEDTSEIVVLDPESLKVVTRWSLSPGEEPTGLAIDVKNHRLFSACGNKMMVIVDADSGEVLNTVAIGDRVDGAAFDPATGNAFTSNGDGTLTVVHEDSPSSFSVAQNVATMRGARTMTLDPKTHNVFLVTAEFAAAPKRSERDPARPSILPGSFQVIVVGR